MRHFLWIGLACTLMSPVAGRAQENDPGPPLIASTELQEMYGDEAFVSIATGSRKPIYKAPAVATVITAEQIKGMGATTLDQVLEAVPGLHVGLSTQGRLDPVYSIRGIHTKFNPEVLILMNGLPFPHISGGRPFDFHLPVAAISRIEIIRGPGSAVFGADAYAGVINIIIKDAEDIGGTAVGGRAGSFETYDLWLQHGKTWGKWDIAFSLEWQRTEGDRGRRISSDLQTTFDQTFETSASQAPGPLDTRYDVVDTHLGIKRGGWGLRYWYWRQEDAGWGAGGALALDPEGGESYDQHLVDLSYHAPDLVSNWDLSANLNYLYRRSDSHFVLLPPGTRLPIGIDGNLDFTSKQFVTFPDGLLGNPAVKDENIGLDLVAVYTSAISHRWRIGAGFKEYRVRVVRETKNFGPGVINGSTNPVDGVLTDVSNTPNAFLPNKSRKAWNLSLQDEWQFARDWELTAGLRYDDYSDFSQTLNPRLALVWNSLHNLTSKLLYGRAFRAPSFTELYSKNNPVAQGNHELDPETIDTVELAFDYRPTFNLQTNLSLFAYRANDLIEFVPDSGGSTITAQNARDQEGYGFELEMDWKALKTLRLYSNYAWQHSEDKKTGDRIPDAPGQKLFISADWRFSPGWLLTPQVLWVGDRKRAAGDARPEIDDYTLVHLILRASELFKNWEFTLAVRNLLDEDAREPSNSTIPDDYPLEGRSVWGEIRYWFGS